MTELSDGNRTMLVGSDYPMVGRAREHQVKADLLTAIRLDHPEIHDLLECDVCLALRWGLIRVAGSLLAEDEAMFTDRVREMVGVESRGTQEEWAKFAEIRGAEGTPESPTEETEG